MGIEKIRKSVEVHKKISRGRLILSPNNFIDLINGGALELSLNNNFILAGKVGEEYIHQARYDGVLIQTKTKNLISNIFRDYEEIQNG